MLTVVSKKHGVFRVHVDQEDYERVSRHTWGVKKNNKRGHIYFQTNVRADGKHTVLRLHRFIMNVTDPKIFVDHTNHNYMDCRKSELRTCTHEENMRNRRKHCNNTSGYKGVYWHKRNKKYTVHIGVNGKRKYLGYRDCPIEAAKLYDAAAREHFGTFAKLNFEGAA